MPAIFLPGPFADADMLAAILGAPPPAAPAPVLLPGHALRADPAGARVALVAEPDGLGAAGGVIEADAAGAARLAFALAAFGAAATREAATETGARAEVRLAADGDAPPAPFAAADAPEWRAHLVEAAKEVMGHFGRLPAEATPALMPGISFRALSRVRGAAEATPALRRSGFGPADVEPVGLARPYAKYFGLEEHRLRHRRFDGRMSPVIDRAVFASGDAVTVVPFDPRRREVMLIEQFRAGLMARRDPSPWCLEAVAGRCDAGETPEETARREAQEEAAITLGRIERIAGYYSSPGIASEHITAFVGEADLAGARGVHGLASEDEDIRTLVAPLAVAMDLVATGEVNNAQLMISLMWLEANADRLVAAWT